MKLRGLKVGVVRSTPVEPTEAPTAPLKASGAFSLGSPADAQRDLARQAAQNAHDILSNPEASDDLRTLAGNVRGPATLVVQFLDDAEAAGSLSAHGVTLAMEAAMEFMHASLTLHVALATSEPGRRGGQRKHANARPRVDRDRDRIVARTKQLKALGRTRAEILDALCREFPVKRSTLEKNPRVRAHLPPNRRKSSP
jgi:hypothetical protein